LSAPILPRLADVISDTDKKKKVASREKIRYWETGFTKPSKALVKSFYAFA
jgi:hypothetical protein